MGSFTSKKPEEEKRDTAKKGVTRSATVYLSPWDNQQRNLNIENLKVEEGEEYESAIFDVKISVLPEEDADTKTKGKANVTQRPKSVLLNNQKPTEEVAILDYKGYVKLCFPLEISKNFIVFTIHQRIRNKWTKTEIKKQHGGYRVEANISDFNVDAIFCTSRQMYEEIIVPPGGFLYRSDFAKEQEIRFPKGSVAANTQMKISTLAVDQDCKKSRIEEKKLSGSGIQSMSNLVYIHHSQPFTKNVTVKLKLDHLSVRDENPHAFVFHCDESGLHILHGVPVRRISRDVCEVDVQTFSGIGVALGDEQISESGRVSAVSNAFGLDFDHCNILIFLHRDERFLYLWSEIVLEADREEREKKRTKEGLFELPKCRSPTIKLKNHDRIRVTVGPKGIMRASRDVPADHCFIYYNKFGTDNHLSIPVVRDIRMGRRDEMAVVQFNMDSKCKTLLHTSYFNSDEYFQGSGPKRSKQLGGLTSNSTSYKTTTNRATLIDTSNTEFFSDKSLCALSRNMSPISIRELALHLGITMTTIEDLHEQYGSDISTFKLQLLLKWRGRGTINPTEKLEELVCALKETDLNSIAEVAVLVYSENRCMESFDFK